MALTLPHSFTNDTIAEASEVNSNFSSVKLFVDALQAGTGLDNLSIAEAKLASSSVSETKIATNAVSKTKIADRAVGSAELDGISINSGTTSAYTLVAGDANRVVTFVATTTVTIPASVFTVGDQVNILQTGAGQITVAAGAGVTLRSEASRVKTRAQWAMATVICIATNEWVVLGNVVA